MLSAVGLALDLVGAVALVIGLFRPPRPLYPGWSYSPDDAAHDFAYGVIGGTFLGLGFLLQSLSYFGVSIDGSHGAVLAAAVGTLAVAAVGALVLYGVTFLVVLPKKIRYSRDEHELHFYVRRQRKGLRFWHQVPDPPSPGSDTAS